MKNLNKNKALREAIRALVYRVLKEEEEETTAKEEPVAQPEPEEQELGGDFQNAVDLFIRKTSQSQDTVTVDDLTDMLSQIIDRFTTTSEERLNLLKGVRNNVIR
jgi:hypothetical protein